MLVVVEYVTRTGEEREFEYFSEFDRINAKGLKEEAKNQMYKNYGYITEIINIYRK